MDAPPRERRERPGAPAEDEDADTRHQRARRHEHQRHSKHSSHREHRDERGDARSRDGHHDRHTRHHSHHSHHSHHDRHAHHGHGDHHDHRRHDHRRHRSRERSAGRSDSRSRHRNHDDARRKTHQGQHETQIVLLRKDEPGRSHTANDVYRDPRGDSDDALYAVDARGDPLVWQFGTTDARRTPAYRRFGHGRAVLGAGSRFVFSLEGARSYFAAEPPSESRGSVFRELRGSASLRARLDPVRTSASTKPKRSRDGAAKTGHRVGASAGADKEAAGPGDFVPLRAASRKRKRDSGAESGSGDDDDGHSSRPGFTDSDDDDSSSSSVASNDSTGEAVGTFTAGDSARAALQQTLAGLSRRVKDDPQDVDAWLQLVDLQDQQSLLLLGNDDDTAAAGLGALAGRPARSDDEVAGIARVKLSILESALQQVRAPADRERLQLAVFREGASVWTAKQLADRWARLAKDHAPGGGGGLSFSLWRARLDFELTNLSTLTVDGARRFMVDRLRHLERQAADAAADAADQADLYAQAIYVFLRLTRFLYDAGFRDLATAAWQAALESAFARPPPADAGAGAVGDLGQFWDSEVPRIGEDGAQGWCAYVAKLRGGPDDAGAAEDALLEYSVPTQALPTVDLTAVAEGARRDGADDLDEYTPLYEAWVVAERERAHQARLPARVIDDYDDGGYEDVFRVVVFASDLEPLLFAIPEPLLPALQPLLVDAFLLFCQLPPAFAASPWIETARNDPFLAIVVLQGDATTTASPERPPGLDGDGRRPPELMYDGSRMVASPDVLFPPPGWFRYLPDWLQPPSSGSGAGSVNGDRNAPVPPRWVASALRQLARSFGFEALAPYSLAVDARVNPAGVKKAARALLKQYMANTDLYEAYALAEAARGNLDAARGVLSSAAAAASVRTDVEAELRLRIAWAWIELEAGRRGGEAARRLVLASAGEGSSSTTTAAAPTAASATMTPAELLRARQALRTGMEFGLSAGLVGRSALFGQAFVLLEYLSDLAVDGDELARHAQRRPHGARQGNLAAAMAAATAFSEELRARGHGAARAHEAFLQGTVARLLFFHARHGPYRPAALQAPLQRMVAAFPQNGVFLRLFAWVDPASASGLARLLRPDDPLRTVLDGVVLAPAHDCPSSRAFAVRHALQAGHGQGHAARAALERALGGGASPAGGPASGNPACRGSARLWQAFVHLTATEAMATARRVASKTKGGAVRVRGVDKTMVALAKDVYYRAVRACPGSKDVLLEAFGPDTGLVWAATPAMASASAASAAAASGAGGMAPSDLRAVFQTLVSKGLRVHIDLGEVLERARSYRVQDRRG